MADDLVRMRVIRAGGNNSGYLRIGDVIAVDAAHAAMFEIVGFAERLEAVTDAETETPGVRRNRRQRR